jgi:hypothetical protein
VTGICEHHAGGYERAVSRIRVVEPENADCTNIKSRDGPSGVGEMGGKDCKSEWH